MLDVFLTVDTELWPFSRGWPTVPLAPEHRDFTREIDFYFHGNTRKGEFGVPYQLECLKQHGLRATYFVESLFASAVGMQPLREIVSVIHQAGQEVQLHAHPEWLGEIHDSSL